MLPHSTCWRFILILFTHRRLGLPSGLFPSCFLTKTLYASLLSSMPAACPSLIILIDLITRIKLVRSTGRKAPRYVVLSIPLFPRPC
jgi:hypothetical protein